MLFEPLGEVVAGVQEVHEQTYPAECQNQDAGDYLAHQGDGFLEDVQYCNNREDNADDVN